jgi:TolB protein
MNSNGTGLVKLTDTTRIVDETASWSPDGTQILFQTDRDRNFEIYMMNADGSDPVNLTNNAGRDYWPDW